ncbi:hypothetical protein [Cognatiluteimonas weifangensis]|uniref:Uncharacterized protein n=1 Tax=Cognatiluteimonas weifangensis TaxID=2303539 RepID=A0A372DQP5_9GAMM|nr:hypothetical protein [Luteimonas weifangensis]RFP61866.1 hypothetical protein D0Y53_02045 [Luteimonas weifangensis]
MRTSPIIRICLLAVLLALSAGAAASETVRASFGASVRVLGANQPDLARSLPLPVPGHVMSEDTRGRHYVYAGALDDARAYYRVQMAARGYTLLDETVLAADAVEMRFHRERELTLVSLRAATGSAPTRIGLRAMRR